MDDLGEVDFKIGEWWVRPQLGQLKRGETSVRVEARSMDVLVCLARLAPEVVPKQRIIDEVWGDAYVGDEVISHAIWELRKALEDDARQPRYIETLPRKGYRLKEDVYFPPGSGEPAVGARMGQYEIEEELGSGAMGVVYAAADRRLGRKVALKFLAPELVRDETARRRFEREARLAASLDHPNLATVHEISETAEGRQYIVTPLYGGGSLEERLAAGRLELDEALEIARQLSRGLAEAHRHDIIHRDVKPANVLLTSNGVAKLVDFGIAKLASGTRLTQTGHSLGTPAYKSPEQSRGEPVDHRADIWAVGVVLYEMISGRRPFAGEYEHAIVRSILEDEPVPLAEAAGRDVTGAVERIVQKALEKDPETRYQTAGELAADLEAVVDGHVGTPAVVQRSSAGRAGLVVAALALVAMIYLGVKNGLPSDSRSVAPAPANAEVKDHLEQAHRLWLRGNAPANLEEVARHYEQAVQLDPDRPEALAHYAVFIADRFAATRNEADLLKTRDLIERTRAKDPQMPLALVAEARLLLVDRRYAEAETVARKAMALEPICSRDSGCDLAYVWLGEALWELGRVDEAEKTLKKGISVGGGRIRCRMKLAQRYRIANEPWKAMVEYEKVLEWDSEQTTALNDYGIILLTSNQYEEAANRFRRLFQKTGDPTAAVNLGHALYGQKRWQEAVEAYQEADRIFRLLGISMPTPAVSIGDVFLEQGREPEAREWFERALVVFDQLRKGAELSRRRQAQRAVCLAKLGRFEQAEQKIQELLTRWPEYPDLLFYAARIYALKQDRKTLFKLARRSVEAGNLPHRLKDDAAFILFRDDADYLRILEPGRSVE
ncbi:MAG: protein kinase [bacterium]|nr:protein kinase [bacterium]